MRRTILWSLGIALVGYVASYVVVRTYSILLPYGGTANPVVVFAVWEADAETAFSVTSESEESRALEAKLDLYSTLFWPMMWLDRKVTGMVFYPQDFEEEKPLPKKG